MEKKEQEQIQLTTTIPPLPLTERGQGLHLGGSLKIVPRFVYCSHNIVVQREIKEFNNCKLNTEHGLKVNVAKYSPNGEWICSGDDGGNCIVWAHQSFVVKNTINVGKKCNDIAWSGDGDKIFAVGSGKDDKGKVFPWNTNNKLGDIAGASKGYLTCDFKPQRPFRLISGSEDYGVYIYIGPPFKFQAYDKTHKNYVNCVRYCPSGEFYISVSSDKTILVFNGTTGEKVKEISDAKNGHTGSIYEISWSADGNQFLTASADKTCKVWDFENGNVVHTFTFSDEPTVDDMQVSCLWLGDYMMSVSLSGRVNYLDVKQERPIKVLTGHRKAIQDMAVDRANGYVYTCDADSRVVRTECKSYECEDLLGDPHNGSIIKYLRLSCDNKYLFTIGANDTLVKSDIQNKNKNLGKDCIELKGSAHAFAVGNKDPDLMIVGIHTNKLLFIKGNQVQEVDLNYTPKAAAISPDDKEVAVGGADKKLYLYSVQNRQQLKSFTLEYIREEIITIDYSPDGKWLATGDRNRHIWVWDRTKIQDPINKGQSYQFHNAVPSTIEWSADSKWIVSCGHDSNIFLWLMASEGKSENYHRDSAFHGAIRRVSFLDNQRLVGTGVDCTIRFFDINVNKQ